MKDFENNISNKDVYEKYGVHKNTVSTWLKNEKKILSGLQKSGTKPKRKKIRLGGYEDIEIAVLQWFLAKRSRNIPIYRILLKEKL